THAQDTERQLVELHAASSAANGLPILPRRRSLAEEAPRPKQLEHIPEDEITDGPGVGVRGVQHLHAAPPASGHVDVFDAHAAAADDSELGGFVEKRVI